MAIRSETVGSQELRIAETRRGSRRPLLLFNGISAKLELAGPFIEALDRTDVITFDIPGVGGSPASIFPYRFSSMASLAARLLDQLGHGEVDVFGVSWGGGLAQQFARDFGGRCRRLILAATSPGAVMVPGDPSVLLKMASAIHIRSPRLLLQFAPDLYGGVLRTRSEQFWEHLQHLDGRHSVGYLYQLGAAAGWTSYHWLHCLHQPTLVVSGADDPLVPPINGSILAQRIPNAVARTIDCGHLFLVTRPQELAGMVEAFLNEEGEFATTPAGA
jgi:poly(3-hydroxyalkanoate) depolymerase